MCKPIDLGEVQKNESTNEFWEIRGHAIQTYANLEQSLCALFASLSGMSREIAAIIFFRIVAKRVVITILEKLLKKKYDTEYREFWISFQKVIFQIDEARNAIVHWNATITVNSQDGSSQLALMPPANILDADSSIPSYTTEDILEFTAKCDFLGRLCNMFTMLLSPPPLWPEEQRKLWRCIFEQEVVYPPPNTHPLSQKTQERETQVRTFRLK